MTRLWPVARLVDWLSRRYAPSLAPWIRGATDVSVLLVQNGISLAIAAVTSILNARGLGPHNLGLVSLTQTVVNLSVSVTTMGVSQTALRYAAREISGGRTEAAHAVLRWALRHRMVFLLVLNAIIFLLADTLATYLWHEPQLTDLIRIALPIGFIATLASIPDIYFQAVRRFYVNALVRIGESLVSLLGVLTLWYLAWWTPQASIMVATTTAAAGAVLFLSTVPRHTIFDGAELKDLWRQRRLLRFPDSAKSDPRDWLSESPDVFAKMVMASSLIVALTQRIDFLALGYYREPSDAGIYSIGQNLSLPLGALAGALIAALYPRMASERTETSLTLLLYRTLRISAIAFAGGALYAVIVPPLIPTLFGDRYADSIVVAQALCIHQSLSLVAAPVTIVGYGFGLARQYVWMNALQLIAIAVSSIVLVPRIGPLGAALGWIAHDLVNLVVLAALLYRKATSASLPTNSD